jgi:exosortase
VTRDSRLASPSAARTATLLAPQRRLETTATAAFGAALLALYLPVLRDLIAVWIHVTYYSYGFVVPLFSAYVAWDAWTSSKAEPRPEPAGFLIIAAGLTAFAAGVAAGSLTARTLSLPVVLMGLALATLGPVLTRQLAFPIGFLAFMAPLPDGTLPALSLPLQEFAALVATHTLGALGVPVVREGLFLRLPSVTLHVTEACNGLRFLLAMLVIGAAFAGTTQVRPLRRAVIVLAALTLAIAANLVRVTGTGVMAELWGARAAMGLPHMVWGKVAYAAALVPFAALVLVIRRRR